MHVHGYYEGEDFMKTLQVLMALALTLCVIAPTGIPAFAADKAVPASPSPHPGPGPAPVPGPTPSPPLEVCKHAGPNLPPQQKCVQETLYDMCGCDNSCTIQFGRPPGNVDPNWDARPLNRCKSACADVQRKANAACFKP